MRNLILSFIIIFVSLGVSAQGTGDSILRSKKGIPILPQKGDWAIGANAAPFFNYLGNIFNNSDDNSLDLNDYTIYARYFVADNAAINFIVSIDNSNNISRQYVDDDAALAADPNSNAQTSDSYKEISTYKSLGFAYQKFRGYGRLKGYYGLQVNYWRSRYQEFYTYGNPMTTANSNPTSWWDNNTSDDTRILESDNSIRQGISAGLIGGVEYFFAPKISAGFNVTLSASHAWRSQSNAKFQQLRGTSIVEYDEPYAPKGRTNTSLFTGMGYGFDGGIYLMFHF